MTTHDFRPFAERFGWPLDASTLPLCIGHRGASGHRVENTLDSFRRAAELGAEMWEIDTQLTKDGEVVVSHDDHLLRVFGVDVRISELTLAELRAMPGHAVPSFSEVTQLAQDLNCGLYVELKAAGSGLPVWRELRARDQRFACLGSFDAEQVRELRDAGCDYPLSVLVRVGHDPHLAGDAAGADILHLCWERAGPSPQDLVTPDLMAQAFARNREIVLWHEERPEVLARLVELPVLGICTDLPDLMRGDGRPRIGHAL